MKVVWTTAALADLDAVLTYTEENYPSLIEPLERRIGSVLARIAKWPTSAREVDERPGIRVVPLLRYPFRLFYRIENGTVEILHIHHASQKD
jgi:plasmid stabilization system protein ParE